MISVSYQFNFKHYMWLYFNNLLSSRLIWITGSVVFFLSFIYSLFSLIISNLGSRPMWLTVGIAIIIAVYQLAIFFVFTFVLSLIIFVFRAWFNRKQFGQLITVSFIVDKIIYKTENFKVEIDWKAVKKITEDRRYFYLHFSQAKINTVIPKRAFFENDRKRFYDLLSSKNLLK